MVNLVSKSRDSIESQVYPTAKIIDGIGTTDIELLMIMHHSLITKKILCFNNIVVGGLIVGSTNPVAAGFTAIVSAAGTIHH